VAEAAADVFIFVPFDRAHYPRELWRVLLDLEHEIVARGFPRLGEHRHHSLLHERGEGSRDQLLNLLERHFKVGVVQRSIGHEGTPTGMAAASAPWHRLPRDVER
jgi:hypothetical protein